MNIISQFKKVITMDNICPYCDKICPNNYALKHHTNKCEITSSSAPARKSPRKTIKPDPVLLNQGSDLENVLSISCPLLSSLYYILFDWL